MKILSANFGRFFSGPRLTPLPPGSCGAPAGLPSVVYRAHSHGLGSRRFGGSVPPSAFRLSPFAFRSSSAFSLAEVVIAMGIAVFCLVAMLGLFPSGLKSAKNTTDQTAASSLLNSIALDLQSTPAGSNTTPLYGLTLPAAGSAATAPTNFFFNEDGSLTNSSTSLSTRYGVLLTMSNPTATTNTTTAWIQVYWPPTVATTNLASALGILESFITINRR